MSNERGAVLINALRKSIVHWGRVYNDQHDVAVFANDYIGRMVITYGRYEKDLLERTTFILSQLIGDESYMDGICLDVGANIGNHALYYSRIFKSVIAFEPNPIAYKLLEASILKNRIQNIDVVPSALGLDKSTLNLNIYDVNLGGASLSDGDSDRDLTIEVDVCAGDDVLEGKVIKDTDISFIKLDVEGFEAKALKGLARTIKKSKPVIVIELNFKTQPQETDEAISVLEELGYKKYFMMVRSSGIQNRYINLLFRMIAGDKRELLEVNKFDKKNNYLQVYCLQ